MKKLRVIIIFDLGKTNKKLLLFDEQLNILKEEICRFNEVMDGDGFAADDIGAIEKWVMESFMLVRANPAFEVIAVNFSSYGASWIYLDENGQRITPLYNYLKPYPAKLLFDFYRKYGEENRISMETSSPSLGNLNAGLQLYRIKKEHPELFSRIQTALHLPQYLSYLLSAKCYSDITSIGCHTYLWNYGDNKYHGWVHDEHLDQLLAPIVDSNKIVGYKKEAAIGPGLHDSSAALIPYLIAFDDPFVLVSTGTWCISMNPFNHSVLTEDELKNDCLCYLTYNGAPVKSSRLFAGNEHEQQVIRLAAYFNVDIDFYKTVTFDPRFVPLPDRAEVSSVPGKQTSSLKEIIFNNRNLGEFNSVAHAYHQLMADITDAQLRSIRLILPDEKGVSVFVDGGFSNNNIYMQLIANGFSHSQVFAAELPQASAVGAALMMMPQIDKTILKKQYTMRRYFAQTKIIQR